MYAKPWQCQIEFPSGDYIEFRLTELSLPVRIILWNQNILFDYNYLFFSSWAKFDDFLSIISVFFRHDLPAPTEVCLYVCVGAWGLLVDVKSIDWEFAQFMYPEKKTKKLSLIDRYMAWAKHMNLDFSGRLDRIIIWR